MNLSHLPNYYQIFNYSCKNTISNFLSFFVLLLFFFFFFFDFHNQIFSEMTTFWNSNKFETIDKFQLVKKMFFFKEGRIPKNEEGSRRIPKVVLTARI